MYAQYQAKAITEILSIEPRQMKQIPSRSSLDNLNNILISTMTKKKFNA